MIFSIDKNILLSAMQQAAHAVAVAKKAQNICGYSGIYRCFVFSTDTDKLTIQASDLDVFISKTVSIDNKDAVKKTFAVDARQFLRTIKTLENQILRIEVLDYQIIVTHSLGSFCFPTDYNVTIFTEKTKGKDSITFARSVTFEAPGLKQILTKCSFATANDYLRPVMNGVCIRFMKEHTDFVASDGHRLARIRKGKMMDCESPVELVLPNQVVSILQKITPSTGFVEAKFNEFVIPTAGAEEKLPELVCEMMIDDVRLLFKPIDGRYPNYNAVIPTGFNIAFDINRQAIIKSLERLTAFANRNAELITLTLSKGALRMDAEDTDFELKANEKIPCNYSGGNFRIGFKASSLLSILKNISAPDITINIVNENRACIILPKPQPYSEEITTLVMPMLIKD